MAISDIIKDRRKKLNMTQNQLAQLVKVTPQAISKWESGIGSPDISLIVPLANALRISTDVLFEHNTLWEFNIKWIRLYAKCVREEASWEDLVDLDNEILQDYPYDVTSLYRRVCDEFCIAKSRKNDEEKKKWILQAEFHCSQLIDEIPEFDAAISKMVEIKVFKGERDSAMLWANKSEDPDNAMKMVLQGDELRLHRQKLISKKLLDLLREMTYTDLGSLKAAEDIIKAVFYDENYLYYYDNLMMIEYNRALYYDKRKDIDNTILHLYKAVDIAKEKIIRGQGKKGQYTVPTLDMLSVEDEPVPLIEQLCDKLSILSPRAFEFAYHTEQYQNLLSDIKALIKELYGKI